MRNIKSNLIGCLSFLTFLNGYSQSTFQNLNFESAANLPNVSPGQQPVLVPTVNALPGWTVYQDGSQVSQIFYNGVSAGGVLVTLVGPNTGAPGHPELAGNYSVTLDDGEGNFDLAAAAIAQTGFVPISTESLRFIASGDVNSFLGVLSVSFNGQNLPIVDLASGANFDTYGVDFSPFAGQTGTLQFTESPSQVAAGVTYLDNITFSPLPIPEPSTWALMLCGAVLLGAVPSQRT